MVDMLRFDGNNLVCSVLANAVSGTQATTFKFSTPHIVVAVQGQESTNA